MVDDGNARIAHPSSTPHFFLWITVELRVHPVDDRVKVGLYLIDIIVTSMR